MYCDAVREELSHGHRKHAWKMVKFGDAVFKLYASGQTDSETDRETDKQTNKQTHSLQYFTPLLRAMNNAFHWPWVLGPWQTCHPSTRDESRLSDTALTSCPSPFHPAAKQVHDNAEKCKVLPKQHGPIALSQIQAYAARPWIRG